MLRSIATVSLGGTLMEKLQAIAAAGFDGVEIFENDLLYFDGSPRRGADASRPISACASCCSSRSAISRRRRARRMQKNFDRAEMQVRRDGAARRRPDAGVQQHRAGHDRRRQRRGRGPARARRARGAARLPHRLRGARLGPAGQHVRPRLEDRAGGGPSGCRARGGQLPYLRDRGRRRADRADSRRPHLLHPARRRADDAARPARRGAGTSASSRARAHSR